jgi:hypothetical protein
MEQKPSQTGFCGVGDSCVPLRSGTSNINKCGTKHGHFETKWRKDEKMLVAVAMNEEGEVPN